MALLQKTKTNFIACEFNGNILTFKTMSQCRSKILNSTYYYYKEGVPPIQNYFRCPWPYNGLLIDYTLDLVLIQYK